MCEEYFGYSPSGKTNEIVEDARVYLAKSNKIYDMIRVDVYNSNQQIPFHLTTLEAVKLIKKNLKQNGIVLINIVGSVEGKNSKFLKSELKTYKEEFENIYVFAKYPEESWRVQNIMIFASDAELDFEKVFENEEVKEFEDNAIEIEFDDGIILTDDYAPVENMIIDYI